MASRPKVAIVAGYLALLAPDQSRELKRVIAIIRKAVPGCTQVISYGIHAFRRDKVFVYCAAFKSHIGFYATPTGNAAFRRELAAYAGGKGSIQFPLDQPLPVDLIRRIVEFRVEETRRRMRPRRKGASKA